MKSIKGIKEMSLGELLAAASDETVQVPEGFMDRIEDVHDVMMKVDALTEDEDSSSIPAGDSTLKRHPSMSMVVRFISAAAAVALIVGIGFGLSASDEPEDTFDDPRLAYAELEKAFATISGGINRGVAMAEDSQRIIEKTSEIFDNNN